MFAPRNKQKLNNLQKEMIETALYLIPVPLSDGAVEEVVPACNIAIVREVKHFIVENVRSARRFLKKCDREINIDELKSKLYEKAKIVHTQRFPYNDFLFQKYDDTDEL